MVTIYDIAKEAGVSAMTVSRVINNTGRISEQTRLKVKRVMDEMNYVPNATARSLVLQQTKLFSLLIVDIANPFYTTLARGAEDAANNEGYKILFSNSDEDIAKEEAYVDMIVSTRVDGVLFAPAGDASLPHLEKLRLHRIPFVLIDREVPGIEADTVLGDSKEGARRLVDYLLSLGHRRIALLNGSPGVSTARHRQTGYLEALKLNDIAFDERLVVEGGYISASNDWADAAVRQLLGAPDPPTAIFAANNFLAASAIRALSRAGLRVPDDISVVCFDELEHPAALDPFLTVAAQPAYRFGSIGIRLLVDRIQSQTHAAPWHKIILPSELIVRKSAAPR
ncbi:LacI family DNA-binding transcriptional regulator [Paenibacillus cymbidii]|uniref:LacI family DNA-binding transcriptional regulator n=1 Tax=Paenibacillus cymbidii TaxID=1639034 RepID=UPI00108066BC|nr:LacI family DNA-binding transcriptional regulator [Paenibacillus cymbidii]